MNDLPVRPTSNPILRTTLIWTGGAAVALAVVGSVTGFLIAGTDGLWSALTGTILAVVFLALTPLSMLIANRWYRQELYTQIFFGIVMGGWLLKFVIFFIAVLVLRQQPWVQPVILFVALVVGIALSLVIDAVAFARTRVPIVADTTLPQRNPEDDAADGAEPEEGGAPGGAGRDS